MIQCSDLYVIKSEKQDLLKSNRYAHEVEYQPIKIIGPLQMQHLSIILCIDVHNSCYPSLHMYAKQFFNKHRITAASIARI